ncbi:MAG: hypothetical protein ACX939_04225 [Hyphococcus sp.]
MSDAPQKPVAASPDTPALTPQDTMTRAERVFVRINVVQTILAVAGVFTGAVALYAALNESEAVRRQSEAAVWPRLQIATGNIDPQTGENVFQLMGVNAGIGPAIITSFRLRVDGEAASDWPQALSRIIGDESPPYMTSYLSGRVLRPGDTVMFLTVRGDAAERLEAAVSRADNPVSVDWTACYCSVFDKCWVLDTLEPATMREPAPVKKCPDFGADQFRQ